RHTRLVSDWSSDVCSSDLLVRVAKTTSIPSYVLPLSKARIASARIISTTVVLARIIREIEDARRLFCYKHVVKTVFVLQERLPACLTIARHSVCYSPTFSTS